MTPADAPPDGFKQTEIGLIPEEWEVNPFVECLARAKGPRRKAIKLREYKAEGLYPIIDQGASYIGGYTDDESAVISENLPVIIFGDHTRVFKYVDLPFALGADGTKALRADTNLVEPLYLYFYLKSLQIPSRGYNRHFKYLKDQIVAIPKSRNEQRAIAHALSKIQAAAQAQAAIAGRARELKRALMAKLFTEGLRGEPLKETEIGVMPEGWEVVRLGDVCAIATGTTPATDKPEYYGGNIPFVKTSEIANNRIVKAETHITEKAVEDYNLRIYPRGTVFMAMYGQGKTRGQVAMLEISAATTQNTAAIRPSDELDSKYLWHWLMGQYNNLRNAGSQGHISHLNLGYVKVYKFPKPPLDEQRDIARILQTVDAKIVAAERKRAGLEELFRVMLGELMTGRVRATSLIDALPV